MGDAEAVRQHLLDRQLRALGVGAGGEVGLERRHRPFLGDRPGVHVVDPRDPRHGIAHRLAGRRRVEALRRRLEQDMRAVGRHPPGRPQDQERDQHRQDRVHRRPPGRQDHAGRHDRADRAQKVAHDVQRRGPDVQVVAVGAVQDPEAGDVHQQPEDGDHQHRAAQHLGRVHQPQDRLDRDPDRQHHQRDAVDEGDQHRDAVEAVGPGLVRRATGEAEAHGGERQRGEVGRHVARVRQQRERARDQAARDLGQHEAPGQGGGDGDRALVPGVGVGAVGVAVAAVVIVVRVHGSGPSAWRRRGPPPGCRRRGPG